jgi:hypothetical protein
LTDPIAIYIDADACPVKTEIYRVAERYGIKVYVVSNSYMNVPRNPRIEQVVVSDSFDAADNSIGMAMANRELLSNLRAMGEITGGPKPMAQRDRSRFLSALDETIQRLKRGKR